MKNQKKVNKMNQSFFMISIIFIGSLSFFCSGNKETKKECDLNIETLKLFLGKPTNDIRDNYGKCFQVNDSILYSDEDIKINTVNIYDDELMAYFEKSTIKDSITRIVILSSRINYKNIIHIGQKFGPVKQLIDVKRPVMPDGYYFVKPKGENDVFIELDLTPMNLSMEELDMLPIKSVPDSITIKSLLIM